jgi:hypothetical protein
MFEFNQLSLPSRRNAMATVRRETLSRRKDAVETAVRAFTVATALRVDVARRAIIPTDVTSCDLPSGVTVRVNAHGRTSVVYPACAASTKFSGLVPEPRDPQMVKSAEAWARAYEARIQAAYEVVVSALIEAERPVTEKAAQEFFFTFDGRVAVN